MRWAEPDKETGELPVEAVTAQLSDRTRLVAVTGASNLIGTRPDVAAISRAVHDAGALVHVDGVHLTPHAAVDVAALGADFYACSPYKFFGPHLGVLAAAPALLETVHPDKLLPSTDNVPERFELGTLPYELLAGTTAAVDVIADAGAHAGLRAASASWRAWPPSRSTRSGCSPGCSRASRASTASPGTATPRCVRRPCSSRSPAAPRSRSTGCSARAA